MRPLIRLFPVIFLLCSFSEGNAQPTPVDSTIGSYHEQLLSYLRSLPSPEGKLALARLEYEYGMKRARQDYEAYLQDRSDDANARMEYALALVSDSATRQTAVKEARQALAQEPGNPELVEGLLTVDLVRLDSDWAGDVRALIAQVRDDAGSLSAMPKATPYQRWFADSVIRDLEHYNDTQAGMDEAAENDLGVVDDELNQVYKRLLSTGDALFRRKLKEAQRAWLEYRDAQMQAFYPMAEKDPGSYGSIFPVCWSSSEASLEQIRLDLLKLWEQSMKDEGDVCGGNYAQGSVKEVFERRKVKRLPIK